MINLKAVIPVAGLGMHMLPATKAIPKEMLPIVDKPMIQYIVDEIVAAGIKEIVLVTHSSRMRLKTTSTPLTNSKRCWSSVLNVNCWRKCSPFVLWRDHHERASGAAAGLGHSILCARPVVGDNPFIVVLPDIIIDTASADPLRYNGGDGGAFQRNRPQRCWQTHERRSVRVLCYPDQRSAGDRRAGEPHR